QKITRELFEMWVRLIAATPESVLWLFADNDGAEKNLRAAAAERGVDSFRLVFAPRVPSAAHLGRLRQADLFIDTFPYTGHT
ncbi:MAG: hypothetical protein GWO24_12480, partial [Akkermansiaceae bacterium]|nr:hypothetical protein [Akkermansiaceae bacterium]